MTTKIKLNLPPHVSLAIDTLRDSGFDAYVVGGCVRDSLLGQKPKDWDITTDAMPDSILQSFSEYRCLTHGIKFGTVTVLICGMPIEVTTYRIDGKYSDSRRPDEVTFARELREDIQRRDFTINSLAYRSDCGVIDFFDGQADLKNSVIRCVGDAYARFSEDALRIMRALRFAARLGFTIEQNTAEAIHALKDSLSAISRERICAELSGLLTSAGDGCTRCLSEFYDVIENIFPELRCAANGNTDAPSGFIGAANGHTSFGDGLFDKADWKSVTEPVGRTAPRLSLRLALLLRHIPVEAAAAALTRLRFDVKTIVSVSVLMRNLHADISPDKVSVLRMLNKIGVESFSDLLDVRAALTPESSNLLERAAQTVAEVLSREDCFTIKELAIDGYALITLGIPPGKDIGRTLNALLELVIDGKCKNETGALTEAARTGIVPYKFEDAIKNTNL